MKIKKFSEKPEDIDSRIGAKPIVCYTNPTIEDENLSKFKPLIKLYDRADIINDIA